MITKKSIQEVLDTVRIEDVVGEFVGLKRRGVNMIGLCPFHGEKTPSFNVSPGRNIFKCFGCGKGGDSITFLKEHENMTFEDSIRWIAKKYNLQLEEVELSAEDVQERMIQDSLYLINDFAVGHFQQQMLGTDYGKSIALHYCKQRGFLDETIQKFSLGWAADSGDALTKAAVAAGYKVELLKKIKLTADSGRDFFRSRLMFPIQNLTGKFVGFAGRTLSNDKSVPKYVNSPESELYIKSKVLYGAFQAKKAIQHFDECIIVEGYSDVISLHQAGIENAVAPCGTALVEEHARIIKRLTRTGNIVFLFDGDAAGIAAATKNLKNVLPQDLNVKVVILPDAEDPDSYIRKHGAEALRTFIADRAQDFIFFKIALQQKEIDKDPISKVKLLRELIELIALIPDQIKRSVYIRECSSALDVSEQSLVGELNKLIYQDLTKKRQAAEKQGSRATDPNHEEGKQFYDEVDYISKPKKTNSEANKTYGNELQEKDIVRILITAGDRIYDTGNNLSIAEYILSNISDIIDDFDDKVYESVAREYLDRVSRGVATNFQYFIQHPDEYIRKLSVDLSSSPDAYSHNWEERHHLPLQFQKMPEENFNLDTEQSLKRFLLRRVIRLCHKNHELIKQHSNGEKMDELIIAMKAHQKFLDMRNSIAKELGVVVLK
ncbi:MAG: DNA primase [Saprospiraceae bacterium]